MKIFKRVLGIILSLVLVVLLVVVGYVIYMEASYYRIDDKQKLEVENNQNKLVARNEEYSITSYNVGFGAYSQDYTFFMDSGTDKDGVVTYGKHSRARSKEECQRNIDGSIGFLKELNSDFMLIQEVDVKAHRSHFIDQLDYMKKAFGEYGSTFGLNFHSPYLAYPFDEPHGSVDAGLLSLFRYQVDFSERRSLPVTTHWINKLAELDRSFTTNRLKITGSDKELVIINIHMSAYDTEGYRDKQLKMLNELLAMEKEAGNYVIVGGDFNHDVSNSLDAFKTEQQKRTDIPRITDDDLTAGFSFADAKNNAPSVRNCNIPFVKDHTYTYVCDGFILSDNIKVNSIENVDKQFLYSDHNPVHLKFELK